jgi:F0F1-type ATP synthase assembly protein I
MSEDSKAPPPKKSSWPEVMRTVGPYMNLGWMFVVSVGLGMLGGWWADTRLGTDPWLFLLGALVGIAVGFYNFFLVVLRK